MKPFKYYNELRDVFTGISVTSADADPPSQLTPLLDDSDDEELVDISSLRKRPNYLSSDDEKQQHPVHDVPAPPRKGCISVNGFAANLSGNRPAVHRSCITGDQ